MSTRSNNNILLSVIITAHAEGSLIEKTLMSARRAISAMPVTNTIEIILHVDRPDKNTSIYIDNHRDTVLKGVQIFTNSFGDLGSSRNFAIRQAKGKYVATIDADDLMSRNWLSGALETLENSTKSTIAHSELTIEFEGADSLVIKHGEIDRTHDTLLSVFANRWNSVIVAPRELLLNFPYTPNSPGYGYEDWHLNCRLIEAGIHNVLVPETAIFVRRKHENSEWLRQKQTMAVLRANPLLNLYNIRRLKTNPFAADSKLLEESSFKLSLKNLAKRSPLVYKVARHIKNKLKNNSVISNQYKIPEWLNDEWQDLHEIEENIHLTQKLLKNLPVYDTLTPEHRIAGSLYKQIADSLRFNSYDYMIFVPWLIKGGADRYSINYANTIASLKPNKRVLVVSTLPIQSVWSVQLDDSVDFLDFGNLTKGTSLEIRYRLLSHLIENTDITHIHIINSELGYDFIRLHEKYIQATDKKVILTAFSQSLDKDGNVFGYSHTHVPQVYHLASLITSDNQAVIDMWIKKYKFDRNKLVVHHQSITDILPVRQRGSNHKSLHVLWAARIAPEKLPELLEPIGRLSGDSVFIDVYGTVDSEYRQLITSLPRNVNYRGGFDGFANLPLDRYDCLLYTSLFDGMPNTILDAAANGIPIIASGVGGIPEFIKDRSTGLLVSDIHNPEKYVEALNVLKMDSELGSVLSKNAQKLLIKEFSPKSYKKAVDKMLNKLNY